ncbi:MAG: T9SS type A sorting domain-containing protein, partial [Gemmatimonadetes bacterium]|nr:T9SS type A sorting domain-containing protein [Gemmatimonadota bacterium]
TRTAIFYAHDYWVGSVSFSPDGKTLASTGIYDKAIKLFDVVAHRHIATLRHSNTILKVSFSPDGKTLASGNTDEITLLDFATRTNTCTLDPAAGHSAWDNRIDLLSFSPDGSILAAASPTSTIALWDMATRTRIKRFPNEHQIVALSFSPDGSILASGQAGGDVYLWDVKGQKQQIGGCDHAGEISSVVFSPNQDFFVTAGTDGEVFLWDTDTQETVAILAQISPVAAVSFSPTQNIMVSSEEGSQLFLWDMSEWLGGSPPTLPKTSGGADNPVIVQTLSEQTADSSDDSSDDSSVNVRATSDLTADTAYEVTEAKLKHGVGVALYLSSTYEYEPSIESIPEAVTVSGIPGVTVFGWGRLSDRRLIVDIGFSGDLDSDAVLTFTVAADAIADYDGPPFSAQIPVTASQENALTPNFPNPFNPETYISYQLAEPSEVTLTIYALNGQVVRHLVQAHQAAGAHEAYWDGRSAFGQPVASGVYFYRLTAGDFTATRKMLIQK